jgi:TolA-binding protein
MYSALKERVRGISLRKLLQKLYFEGAFMKRCISSSRCVVLAGLATLAIATTGSVFAQSVDQVLQADQRRLTLAQQSQERINNIVQGTRSLEDQYRAINKEIDGLRVYNRLMGAQTDGQQATLEDIALSMDQVDVINRQIFPLMTRMIDGLEQSIALDVPFLMQERTERVAKLHEIMERSDVSVSEKFRKVMEAYQIENDYGTSSETYAETLTFGDDTRSYNILRIGRVGLYFQSDDAQITGRWDNTAREWVRDDSSRAEIRKGLRMAKQIIAPEIIVIPISAAISAEAS